MGCLSSSPAESKSRNAANSFAELMPESPNHVELIEATFPFQGYIENTECRGITLKQLERVVQYVAKSCSAWNDVSRISRTSGRIISMDWASLYHVNSWVIRPATKSRNCAFVELLSAEPQSPRWFVSHWWGEAIVDFLKSLQQHYSLRELGDGDPYWVCAYANRQHSLGSDLASDPSKTSFFKAMQLVDGVLLILDAKATPFKRIWCDYEQSIAIREDRILLDIATVDHQGNAHVLTQGVVPEDIRPHGEGTAMYFKADREEKFPLEVIHSGLNVEIQKGEASMPEDRIHILNSLCGRTNLNKVPLLESHDHYDQVNKRLRAVFATAAATQAAKRDEVVKLGLLEIIAEDRWRLDLTLEMSEWKSAPSAAPLWTKCLGKLVQIQRLSLALHDSTISDLTDLTKGIALLVSLQALYLGLDGTQVAEVGEVGRSIANRHNLQEFRLSVKRTNVTDIDQVAKVIANLERLQNFELCLTSTPVEDVQELRRAVSRLVNLHKFYVDFEDTQLFDISSRQIFASREQFLDRLRFTIV